MAMVVKNNLDANSTLNKLNKNSKDLSKSLKKVSSGMKINSAADGASEYSISERMRVRIRSLDQANQNTQNGNSMLKTAEGAINSTVEILKTLKEKAINAANDTNNSETDRQTIQKEIDQLVDQIDDNANVTYNGKYLLDGTKNSAGSATKSTYINMSLATDTTASTALTDLKDRAGHHLEIQSTDRLFTTYVTGGDGVTMIPDQPLFLVADKSISVMLSNIDEPFSDPISVGSIAGTSHGGSNVSTPDGENAVIISARDPGIAGQISSLTVRITDSEGNIKTRATQALNNFIEVIHPEDASEDNAITFHTGEKSNQSIKVGLKDMRSQALGLRNNKGSQVSVETRGMANISVNLLDNALSRALDMQTTLGAIQARFDYTSSNLTVSSENTSASESTIRDADMAKEMTEYTKNNVLLQASQSMLAQANQNSSAVLSLLQ
ncbi:MAG: flagellin [Selenomonadaceae bacterium]|nr:flagellin [Selenomonadaceae bacterium]